MEPLLVDLAKNGRTVNLDLDERRLGPYPKSKIDKIILD